MRDLPHITVATVVHHHRKFLMVRERTEGGDVYNQPAGHLEKGETLEQAAVRETLEETGWLVELVGILGVSHYHSKGNQTTYVRVTYSANPVKHNAHLALDHGIIEATWLSAQMLKNKPLRSPMVLHDIDRYLTGTLYPKSLYSSMNI